MRSFRRVNSKQQDVRMLQDVLEGVFRELLALPILDGRLIEDLEITASPYTYTVEHGLGRAYRGWIIVKSNAAVDFKQNDNGLSRTTIEIEASGAVTFSIWVF